MKKIVAVFALIASLWSCQAQETEFSKKSLESKFKDLENKEVNFQQILEKHKGKTIFIEVWASWCSDCIKAMPTVKELYDVYGSDIVFVNLSCDKTYESWLAGIEKHQVKGEHYLVPDGMKGKFGKSIGLDWIPRYMIVDKTGKIALYKAIEPTDSRIEEIINK